jgi:iron complex outermembrane receptor protein
VYAASKFVQDVARAPSSVSIVTADEIRVHGYRTLADILRNVRGFYITNDRNYSYVGVRGFARPGDLNSRVLVLLNGHRLNDTIFDQAMLGTESPIDVALIERVEIVRGPSSSLYGTNAFFAVVNIITRAGRSIDGVEAAGALGSQTLRSGRVTAGGRRADGLEGLFSASVYDSGGNSRLYYPEYDTPSTNHGVASDMDGDRSTSVFASATSGSMTVQGGFGARTKTIPTAAFGTLFNDPRTETRDARGFLDLHYVRRLAPRTTLEVKAAYDQYTYDGHFAYEAGLFRDGARGAWVTTDAAIVRQFDHHGVTAGGEYRDNIKQDQSASDQTGTLLDDHRSSQIAALYAEDELHLGPRVLLNAGARWDHYFDTFGDTINPRLGLIVLPREGTALKALYGRAFRAPNPYELYYDQNALSATLAPERITTYEFIWEQRLNPLARVMASAFHYRASDLIAQRSGADTLDGLYFQNADTANASGVEFEVQIDLPDAVHLRLAQTFQSVVDAATDTALSNSPRALGNVLLDVPVARTGLRLGFNGARIGSRNTILGGTVDGAFVGDLTLSRQVPSGGLGFVISIRNLFDESYADPGSVEHLQYAIPQDGTTTSAEVTWKF